MYDKFMIPLSYWCPICPYKFDKIRYCNTFLKIICYILGCGMEERLDGREGADILYQLPGEQSQYVAVHGARCCRCGSGNNCM